MFCGATWPLLTGMFTKEEAPFRSKSRSCKCWLLPLNACSTRPRLSTEYYWTTSPVQYYTSSSMTCLSRLDARAARGRSGRTFWVGSSSRSIARGGMDHACVRSRPPLFVLCLPLTAWALANMPAGSDVAPSGLIVPSTSGPWSQPHAAPDCRKTLESSDKRVELLVRKEEFNGAWNC